MVANGHLLFLTALILLLFSVLASTSNLSLVSEGFISGVLDAGTGGGKGVGDYLSPEDVLPDAPVPEFGPAATGLKDPRKPYHLLEGVLKDAAKDNDILNGPASGCCYESDFVTKMQLVSNYAQVTNNYKRKSADSCTAPFHELINNFYETPAL